MGRYYQSSESVWEKEVRKQEKIGKGIDAIYKLDKMLEKAYEDIEHDRYGNMQTYCYHSLKSEIKECERINEALYEYARRIHDKVVEREHEFTKRISESIEELSHINIKEFTTKNTLGITEKRVMNTSTGGYYTTNGQIVEVKKSRINIVDIQMKTDIMGIDKQIEEEIKKGQGKLSEEEIKKIKEEYYQEYLETSFQHEIYVEGWKKVVSTSIDFLPFIGGAKNIIEGIAGYTFTGEKLSGQERVMYGVLGTVTTVVDVFTLGTAGGMIKGGVYVGKEAAKGSIKQLGKAAILETATSITVGWTSEFASEKLRGMGLDAGEIFAINLLIGVGVGTAGNKVINKLEAKAIKKNVINNIEASQLARKSSNFSKYLEIEKLHNIKQELGLKNIEEVKDILNYTGMSADEMKSALKTGSIDDILGLSDKNMKYLMKETGMTLEEIVEGLRKQGIDIESVNPSNVDEVLSNLQGETLPKDYYEKVSGFHHDSASNKVKGNFGEITSDYTMRYAKYIKNEGYELELISNTVPVKLTDKNHQGIDAIYRNTGTNQTYEYVIVESKYNTAKLSTGSKDGKQMSDSWTLGKVSKIDRISDAVDGDEDLTRNIKQALKDNKVARVLSKVDIEGNVVTYLLDMNGKEIGLWP